MAVKTVVKKKIKKAKKQTVIKLKDIDYKNVEVLKKFLSPRYKILSREISGLNAKMQRKLSQEVKKSRIMGLLPFTDMHVIKFD